MFSLSFRPFITALALSLILLLPASSVYAQDGGGSLNRDLIGGALLIFRQPENPPVGGGRLQGHRVTPRVAKEQNRIIARGNAARSAPIPRYSEAEQEYRQAARLDPTDARSYAGLGNVYLDQSRFNDAIEQYKDALKHKPDENHAVIPVGYSHVRVKTFSEAI